MKIPFVSARVLRAVFVVGAALGVPLAAGCSGQSSSSPTTEPSSAKAPATDPESVAVDFYSDGKVTAACAGTLLSSNVVLTAAHCADGSKSARVRAPGASGQTAEVKQIMRYDWGLAANHAQEHDLALLVLRAPINAPQYATVTRNACPGCTAVAYGRSPDGVTKSAPMPLDAQSPKGRPFALRFASAPAGAVGGGGVKNAGGTLVGVYMGQGSSTSAGYVARIDMPEIQIWLRSVVQTHGGTLQSTSPSAPPGTLHVQSLKLQSTGGGGGDGSSDGPDGNADGSNAPGDPEEDVSGNGDNGNTGDVVPDEPKPFDENTGDEPSPSANPPAGQKRSTGDNYWVSAADKDPAFKNDPDYAKAHPDAAVVGAHGSPGYMTDRPDGDTLGKLTKDKTGPMIVHSCFAGAPDSSGKTNAERLADSASFPRDRTWGCTGESASVSSSSMYCDGNWVDGNGKSVSADQISKYGLKNCKVTARNSAGAWTQYNCP